MDKKLSLKTVLLALACGSFAASALAQWHWIDKDGRKVFSDRPPPTDIAAKNILTQPGAKAVAPPADGAAAAPVSTMPLKPNAPRLSGKDAQLEARRKQAVDEDTLKKKTEEEKLAKDRSANCERAKKALDTLQSGVRISLINAKGEREFMDDAGRAAEAKRLQGIAQSDCLN